MKLAEIVAYLNEFLRVADIPDGPGALNGLQVENSGDVHRAAVAVDACQVSIEGAIASEADLLIVHHGLFWGDVEPVTGRRWRRLRRLIEHDIAVYSAHIPLDIHADVGNNACLADRLGLTDVAPFGDYHGVDIGVRGSLDLPRNELTDRLTKVLGATPTVIAGGPTAVSNVGIVTGAGGSMLSQVRDAGIDTFITGEGAHHTYFDAEEWGLNVFYGGHYATETFGVKALAEHLEKRFRLPWEFVDHPTGL